MGAAQTAAPDPLHGLTARARMGGQPERPPAPPGRRTRTCPHPHRSPGCFRASLLTQRLEAPPGTTSAHTAQKCREASGAGDRPLTELVVRFSSLLPTTARRRPCVCLPRSWPSKSESAGSTPSRGQPSHAQSCGLFLPPLPPSPASLRPVARGCSAPRGHQSKEAFHLAPVSGKRGLNHGVTPDSRLRGEDRGSGLFCRPAAVKTWPLLILGGGGLWDGAARPFLKVLLWWVGTKSKRVGCLTTWQLWFLPGTGR